MNIMNLSSKPADDGSVKGFLRDVIARGRERDRGTQTEALFSRILRGCHPGNVLDFSLEVAGNPLIQGIFRAAVRAVQDATRTSTPSLAQMSHAVGENLHRIVPRLPPAARRDLRAFLFLVSMGLENTSSADIQSAIQGLIETDAETFPMSVKKALGLIAVVAINGLIPVGDPETTSRAAVELWRLARTNEDEEMVHDAWDLAVACEADLDEGPKVPFEAKRAVG